MNPRRTLTLSALAVALITTVLCLLTMNRTFGFIDAGEMAAAAATFGVPHPTGYPLLMLLGKSATILFPGRDVTALNVLAALLVGASAFVLTLLFDRVVRSIGTDAMPEATEGEPTDRSGGPTWLASAAAALTTATSPLWWGTGTGFEAYALHALLMTLVTYLFLRFVDGEKLRDGRRIAPQRAGFLFAFLLGLSFSNHMMTVLLAPPFLVYYAVRLGVNRRSMLGLVGLIPPFLLGLLPYLILWLRAKANPPINWGRPDNGARLLEHVSGGQYGGLMFDWSVVPEQLGWYFSQLPGELAWIGTAVALFGLVVVARRSRPLFLFLLLLIVTTLLFAGSYAIREIEPYFLTATMAFGMALAIGLRGVGEKLGRVGLIAAAAVIPLLGIILHYGAVDRSGETLAEDVARDLLEPLPPNALLLTTRWDLLISGALYLQEVEKVRPDVTVVNLGMLADRSYLGALLERHPELNRSPKAIRAYLAATKRVEEEPDNAARRGAQAVLLRRMVEHLLVRSGRPTLVTAEVDPAILPRATRVPYGLARIMVMDSAYYSVTPPTYRFRAGKGRADDIRATDIEGVSAAVLYATAERDRADYEARHGRDTLERVYRDRLGAYDPGIDPDDVPPLPLGNQRFVRESVRWLEREGVGSGE